MDFFLVEQGREKDDRPHFLFNVLVKGTEEEVLALKVSG